MLPETAVMVSRRVTTVQNLGAPVEPVTADDIVASAALDPMLSRILRLIPLYDDVHVVARHSKWLKHRRRLLS